MSVSRPSLQGARDLLLVVGVAMFVIGLGAVTTGLTSPVATSGAVHTAVVPASGLALSHPFERTLASTPPTSADASPRSGELTERTHPVDIARQGERQLYLQEMAAR